MPKHFHKPWEKWEFVEEILIDLGANQYRGAEEFRKALNKMNRAELAILSHQIKERINKKRNIK
jgi:hypothetical protein